MVNKKNAIIDIGSNTIRLVMYQYDKYKGLQEFENIKMVARLRNYIESNGDMSEKGIQILKDTLNTFKEIMEDFKISNVKASATAAIRQAKNNQYIIQKMKKETGISIDLLTEEEEAYFGFLAVTHSMDIQSGVTIDIGGGSTEITLFENKELINSISFPFGTISLKQKFVAGNIINETEKKKLYQAIKKEMKKISWLENLQLPIIGIGGSARNIAQIHQHIIDYPISGLHQYEMSQTDLEKLGGYLGPMTIEQLKQLDGLSSDRADIIEIALEVFLALLDVVNSNRFQISKNGLREGLIIHHVLQTDPNAYKKFEIIGKETEKLAYKYGRSEKEVDALVSLTDQIYKEMVQLNIFKFKKEQYDLLLNAAKIYSIGDFIESDSSNQHTFYLIAHQSIPGLNHKNRVKLALLASYKNRDYFRRFSAPFLSWFTQEELKNLRDFGAILKFVYSLNVSRRCIIESVKLQKKDGFIEIDVAIRDNAAAEKYQVERQKKHIERIVKQPVQIQFFDVKERVK